MFNRSTCNQKTAVPAMSLWANGAITYGGGFACLLAAPALPTLLPG